MDTNQLKYLNAVNILVKAKVGALQAISRKFRYDFERAWRADLLRFLPKDLDYQKKFGINPEQEWAKLETEGIQVITIKDNSYPQPLRHIADPPFVLYVRGNKDALHGKCFAIVGTRALTDYGKRSTPHIATDIARAGFTIVSGLATGIDTLAHRAALEAGTPTIAVLACGIDDRTIFPQSNLGLVRKIIESGGAIISEYPAGLEAKQFTFPQRNRIISGLSKGVLVVEAAEQSGAMITAKCALDQNRDLFAIPGNIFAKTSQGTNNIIKAGAKLVTCAQDICEDYGILQDRPKLKVKADNEIEERVLAVLSGGETMIADEIVRQTGLDTAQANAALAIMEINKKIRSISGRFTLY